MQPGWGCSAILISLTPNHRAVRLQLKKCELYQISCQGVRMQMHTWCHEGLSLPLALSRPLFLYLCLCPSLSDELGDSLFCRKCSHHTDCRLVYSRFNLIIASPAFNQPASACFMLKPCCKHKTDFDARRPAKPSQRKKKKKKTSTETQDETEVLSFKYSICISALTVCLKPARSPGADLLSLRHKRAAWESSAASATRKDWHIFACVHMWRHRSLSPQTHGTDRHLASGKMDGAGVWELQCGNFQRPWNMQAVMAGPTAST